MLYPQRRNRDRPVRYKDGSQSHITYADWKGLPVILNTLLNNYGKVDRFVHKSQVLITAEPENEPSHRVLPLPRFNPAIKQGFYAVGDEKSNVTSFGLVNAESYFTRWVRGNYWLSKNNKCLNWDVDNIYVDGVTHSIVGIYGSPLRRKRCVVCCAYGSIITATDLTTWGSGYTAAIGKNKVIIIIYDGVAAKFFIEIYAENSNYYYPITALYTREIPLVDYELAFNFVFAGFKTDGKTLIFHKSTYSPPTPAEECSEGGVFKMEFNDTYTSEVVTKLGSHHFEQWTVTSSFTENYVSDSDNSFVGQLDENVSNEGHHVLQIYQHQDDFTVIYQRLTAYNWHEDYSRITGGTPTTTTSTVNGSYSEQRDYRIFKIDFETNSVVDCNKVAVSYFDNFNYGSFDIDGVGSYHNTIEKEGTDAKILYANHALELYVYRETLSTGEVTHTYDGTTFVGTAIYNTDFTLTLDHEGIKTVIDTINYPQNTDVASIYSSIGDTKGHYYNSTATYEYEPYYLDTKRNCAFDGTLLIICVDLYWYNIGMSGQYRKNPRTLIYNVKTKAWQIMDYRVDNDIARPDKVFPLSVTNLPKELI